MATASITAVGCVPGVLNALLVCVVQEVVICKDNDKLRLLEDQLSRVGDKRVIVFVNTKTHCDVVSRHLDHLSYHCTVLHGGKTQVRPPIMHLKHHPLPCSATSKHCKLVERACLLPCS